MMAVLLVAGNAPPGLNVEAEARTASGSVGIAQAPGTAAEVRASTPQLLLARLPLEAYDAGNPAGLSSPAAPAAWHWAQRAVAWSVVICVLLVRLTVVRPGAVRFVPVKTSATGLWHV